MRKKFLSIITAVMLSAGLVFSYGAASADAAVIDEGFESVSAGSEDEVSAYSASALPSKYSSRDAGFVTNIKNQNYNDCWAYAGLASFESKLLKNGFGIEDMSVDHLNVWATKRSNGKGWQRTRTGDGYTYITTGYLTSWQGGVEQSALGSVDFGLDYYGDDMPTGLAKYGTCAIKYLTSYDKDEIKQAVVDNGGVFTSYATTSICYNSDNTAYFMPKTYTGGYTGHSIEIVGWDDDYSRDNFNGKVNKKPIKNGAWLVKNSWGNYNSLGGYFWISYEDKYVFGSKYDPSFTIEQVEEIDDRTRLVQNEIYGATYSFGYLDYEEITYINRFDFDKKFDTLDKVIFETKTAGADYEIFYIPIENDSPVKDQSKWTKLYSGIVDYDGYICCDIEDFVIPDSDGAVGVKINTAKINEGIDKADEENYTPNNLGIGEWLVKSDKKYTFLNESQKGESYICTDGTMMDVMDFYKTYNNDDMGGTFVIKAVTKYVPRVTMLGDVDMNNTLSVRDATLIQKKLVQLVKLDEVQMLNADFNCDKVIDVSDATAILKRIVGIA